MPLIGILAFAPPDDPAVSLNLAGLRQGLKDAGFIEGKNVAIEYRWANGVESRLPELAAELVARRVDVIVTEGGRATALAATAATKTIPVVFHTSDAIADGMVNNLGRPDGNLTGVSLFAPELSLKQLQLLLEIIPQAKSVASLAVPKNNIDSLSVRQLEDTARAKGLRFQSVSADTNTDLDAVYASLIRLGADGLVVRANAIYVDKIVELAARYRIPTVYNQRAYTDRGGLLSYGISIPAVYVVKGRYTAKLLKGAKPADLPVQQPDRFELVINLQTAKALGLTVPQSILARADEVIE